MLPGLDAILAPPAGGVGAACGPAQVLSGQAVARFSWRRGACWPLPPWGPVLLFGGRYLRSLLVLASFFLTQFLVSAHFRSERSRLTSASDRGSGNFRSVMEPSWFVVESHSTPWASGSSAASLAHSSAISLPPMPWWLGHHRISTLALGSFARRAAMWLLACRAYFCLVPARRRSSSRWPPARP